ncbi:MAG: type IV pili methyl-accepting chemotaxis transducer N-terminal domain-containing protein [Magnetococcus sp. DMHC-8]
MKRLLDRCLALLLLLVMWCGWPSPAPALDATPSDMNVIINLAGKQRMLTQKMGKEMLLVLMGVHAAENRHNLEGTAILFDRTLKGLLQGDAGLGLVKVDHPDIVAQLHGVAECWVLFQRHVHDVLTGRMAHRALDRMADDNLALLDSMNKAVEMYVALARKNQGDPFQVSLFTVINLSGRQRMLTQKMTKEWLLILHGVDPEGHRARLKETMALFDRTQDGLLEGNAELGLPGTRDGAIRNQLGKVKTLWSQYRSILDGAVTGSGGSERGAMEQVVRLNLRLLEEVNMTVKMYESTAGRRAHSGFWLRGMASDS